VAKMVKHVYRVSVEVPAVSGDGWNKYPDYSQEEIGRLIRRALFNYGPQLLATVDFEKTESVKEP